MTEADVRTGVHDALRNGRITLSAIDWGKLLAGEGFTFTHRTFSRDQLGQLYCPWYFVREMSGLKKVPYEHALSDKEARSLRISEVETAALDNSSLERIATYKSTYREMAPPLPLIVARGCETNRALILDGNHTAVSVYQLNNSELRLISYEICGPQIEKIIGDFVIVNRS